ncbi:MAG: O-methyltransferase [candidate division Zixibacteria bacterium]|nr:O-methyltransferase [candidate division Zixibacteria bacterium]MDD5426021.1 O-methyltransferase [candidate division Zixibacteria bacterium]
MSTKLDKYLLKVTPERHPVLAEMEQYARENHFPIVGPLVGRLLYQLVLTVKARKLLELGSGFGYSAFWLSLAVGSKGHITLTDTRMQNKRRAYDYFKKAGLQSQFDFKVTDALMALKKLSGPYDLIFNDIDKEGYPETIAPAAHLLRKGGLFVTDNVFLSGRVLDKNPDKTAQAVLDFTNRLYQDSRFFTTLIPLRDGLSVAVRV